MQLSTRECLAACFFTACLLLATPANAREPFLNTWSSIYPNSSSDEAQCQLCHARPDGGVGWNAYGWDIRQAFQDNGGVIAAAIAGSLSDPNVNGVEDLNSDADNTGASNITEINDGLQPGWSEGELNTIYCTVDDTVACGGQVILLNQRPPSLSSAIDPPARAINPIEQRIVKSRSIKLTTIADGFVAPRQAIAASAQVATTSAAY